MSQRGLTLAELIVALGLVTMLLLATIQLFTFLLATGGKTSASMVAMNLAASKLEEEVSGVGGTAAGKVGVYTLDPASNTQFYYQVNKLPLSGDSSSPQGNYLGGYTVVVQVWWNSDSPTRVHAGVGLQQVKLSRFIYYRNLVP